MAYPQSAVHVVLLHGECLMKLSIRFRTATAIIQHGQTVPQNLQGTFCTVL